jgi:hypothetical protein
VLGLALKSNFIAVPGSLLLMFPEPGVAHCVIEIRCKLLELMMLPTCPSEWNFCHPRLATLNIIPCQYRIDCENS